MKNTDIKKIVNEPKMFGTVLGVGIRGGGGTGLEVVRIRREWRGGGG